MLRVAEEDVMLVEARSGRVRMHRRVSCIIRLEVFSLAFRAISDLVQSHHERHQIDITLVRKQRVWRHPPLSQPPSHYKEFVKYRAGKQPRVPGSCVVGLNSRQIPLLSNEMRAFYITITQQYSLLL